VKDVGDAIAFEHVGEALRPGHSAIVAELHGAFRFASDLFDEEINR
jgi:hypothetical protein